VDSKVFRGDDLSWIGEVRVYGVRRGKSRRCRTATKDNRSVLMYLSRGKKKIAEKNSEYPHKTYNDIDYSYGQWAL
jgi:hypothetical protein